MSLSNFKVVVRRYAKRSNSSVNSLLNWNSSRVVLVYFLWNDFIGVWLVVYKWRITYVDSRNGNNSHLLIFDILLALKNEDS